MEEGGGKRMEMMAVWIQFCEKPTFLLSFLYYFISCMSQVGLMPRPLLLTKLCKDLETEPERGMNQPISP